MAAGAIVAIGMPVLVGAGPPSVAVAGETGAGTVVGEDKGMGTDVAMARTGVTVLAGEVDVVVATAGRVGVLVAVGGSGVAVAVGGSGVALGGTGVAVTVGGTGVAVEIDTAELVAVAVGAVVCVVVAAGTDVLVAEGAVTTVSVGLIVGIVVFVRPGIPACVAVAAIGVLLAVADAVSIEDGVVDAVGCTVGEPVDTPVTVTDSRRVEWSVPA